MPRPAPQRRSVLATAVLVIGAVAIVLSQRSAAGAAGPVSQGQAQFLDGTTASVDLGGLVAATTAQNLGGAAASAAQSLDVAAWQAADVDIDGSPLLGAEPLLALGAANEYARADPDGSSAAAAGAVTSSGVIAAGQAGVPQATASLDLGPLLASHTPAGVMAAASLSTGAIAATAQQAADGTQTGTYLIDGMQLRLRSPLVSGVTSVLGTVPGIDPLIAAIGPVTDAGVTVDIATGAVTVDVATVLDSTGLALSALPANSDLLAVIAQALTDHLAAAITAALDQLVDAVAGALGPLVQLTVQGLLSPVLSGLGGTVVAPLTAALSSLLAINGNVQSADGGAFSETALVLGIVPATPLAVVRLATAAVGPNAGPSPPTVAGLVPDRGPTAGGTVVTVTGTQFAPGSTVSVDGGAPITPDTIAPDGTTLSFTTPPHAAGAVSVTVRNPTGSSPPLTYTYLPPDAPVITSPTSGATLTTALPPIVGTGTPGDAVTVHEAAATVCTASVPADGSWSCLPGAPLADGPHTVTATQSDGTASSPASAPDTFTVDTAPPATDPPATDPPATDPPATDPPATDPPASDPPATDPPATDPPASDPPATGPPATATSAGAGEQSAPVDQPGSSSNPSAPTGPSTTAVTPAADKVRPEDIPPLASTGVPVLQLSALGLLLVIVGAPAIAAPGSSRRRRE